VKESFDQSGYPRSESTALRCSELSSLVTITHPFHPLRGKRYAVVKSKKWEKRELLSLLVPERGTIAIPREWTDRGDPALCVGQSEQLSYEHLAELCELISDIKAGNEQEEKGH